MNELVPLKVKIGLKPNGHAEYPAFKDVMRDLNLSGDWSNYIDRFGGWHYDCCGHQEAEPDSPVGMQWGMLCVPKEFAEKCVELFPDTCSVLTESECEEFYNNKAHRDDPEFHEDLQELQTIAALEALGEDVTARKAKALDPDDPARGRRRNKRKFWSDYKQQRGVTIDDASVHLLSERRRQALEIRGNGSAPDAGKPSRT